MHGFYEKHTWFSQKACMQVNNRQSSTERPTIVSHTVDDRQPSGRQLSAAGKIGVQYTKYKDKRFRSTVFISINNLVKFNNSQ